MREQRRARDPQQHVDHRGRSISAACWGNADLSAGYPVATKRVLRAILKAADLCASEPGGVAQLWSIGVHRAL